MLSLFYRNTFKKDFKRAEKQRKNLVPLKMVIELLTEEKPLPQKFKDHPLRGNYIGRRECHLEPDWLLIYLIKNENIIFIRTGTHADLFN